MKNISFILILYFFPITIEAQINKSFSSLEKEFVVKRLFDNAEFNSKGEILWTPNYSEAINNQVSDDNYCHTIMDTIMYYSTSEYDNAVIVFATYYYENGVKSSCHACAPMIGVATFERKIDTNWQIKQFQKSLMYSGSWGGMDKVALNKIGNNTYCLSLSGGYGNQGCFDNYTYYYSLKPEDEFRKLFFYYSYSSDEGAMEESQATIKKTNIRLLPTTDQYYAIELSTKSNRSKQIEKAIYNYSYDEEHFILSKKQIINTK